MAQYEQTTSELIKDINTRLQELLTLAKTRPAIWRPFVASTNTSVVSSNSSFDWIQVPGTPNVPIIVSGNTFLIDIWINGETSNCEMNLSFSVYDSSFNLIQGATPGTSTTWYNPGSGNAKYSNTIRSQVTVPSSGTYTVFLLWKVSSFGSSTATINAETTILRNI